MPRQIRDSKTVGFGGFLVTFSAAKKSLRPEAELAPAPAGAEHPRRRGKAAKRSLYPAGRSTFITPLIWLSLRMTVRSCSLSET